MSNIIHAIIYLTAALASWYVWRRYEETDYLWFMAIALLGALMDVADYSVNNIFNAPSQIHFISNIAFLVLDPILIALAVIILFRQSRKNKKN